MPVNKRLAHIACCTTLVLSGSRNMSAQYFKYPTHATKAGCCTSVDTSADAPASRCRMPILSRHAQTAHIMCLCHHSLHSPEQPAPFFSVYTEDTAFSRGKQADTFCITEKKTPSARSMLPACCHKKGQQHGSRFLFLTQDGTGMIQCFCPVRLCDRQGRRIFSEKHFSLTVSTFSTDWLLPEFRLMTVCLCNQSVVFCVQGMMQAARPIPDRRW